MQHFSGPRAWDDWGGQFKRASIRNFAQQEESIIRALVETLQADRAARIALVDQLLNDVSDLERLFELWSEWWRSLLLHQAGVSTEPGLDNYALGNETTIAVSPQEVVKAIKRIDEAREWVRANVNARLALETLVLHLPEAS